MDAPTCVDEGVAEGGHLASIPRSEQGRLRRFCPAVQAIAAAAAVSGTVVTGMTAISIGNAILGCWRLLSGVPGLLREGAVSVSVHCTGGPAPWGLAWPGFQRAHRGMVSSASLGALSLSRLGGSGLTFRLTGGRRCWGSWHRRCAARRSAAFPAGRRGRLPSPGVPGRGPG